MIIYQALTRLYGTGKMSGFDSRTFTYLRSLGVSHIWYTGIVRHTTGQEYVKGDPGSPYSIKDYYDVNPYLADNESERMDEFKSLVKRTHKEGFKVLTDFIPNHVSPDNVNDIPNCGCCDYDWTDTVKLDYSKPETAKKLYDIVRFWAGLGVDGVRCDMVELVPAEFFKWLIAEIKAEFPEFVFIAEVYNLDSYHHYVDYVGFDLLYDKSGLYDSLRAINGGYATAHAITRNWQRLEGLHEHMLNFLENHDEQRLASPYFSGSAEKGFAALAVSALFNRASFMLYFGQEVGEDAHDGAEGRTSIFNFARHIDPALQAEQDPHAASILAKYREVLTHAASPLFRDGANYDLCYCQNPGEFDLDHCFSFLRYDGDQCALVACNFSDETKKMRIHIPADAQNLLPFPLDSEIEISVPAWDYQLRIFLKS